MVFLTRTLLFAKKLEFVNKLSRNKFIDSLRIHIMGGTGGSGLPKYGGIGGDGGCVYCIGSETQKLRNILKTYPSLEIKAKHGESSKKSKYIGSAGEDVQIEVPTGITIYSENAVIGEINNVGDTCILARGGSGGKPDNNFLGLNGENKMVIFDLKLIADVGFVGFPNAGKSTLLKALSKAKPKIANYPFTTIRPNLGTILFNDHRKITLADLPGLIEGAHLNIGMGYKFLKHVERTKLLLLIADVQGFQLSPHHRVRSCLETVLLLNKEIELYNPEILNKPAILLINKMDTENANEKFLEVKHKLNRIEDYVQEFSPDILPTLFLDFEEIVGISAKENDGINETKDVIRKIIDRYSLNEEEADDAIENLKTKIIEKGPRLT